MRWVRVLVRILTHCEDKRMRVQHGNTPKCASNTLDRVVDEVWVSIWSSAFGTLSMTTTTTRYCPLFVMRGRAMIS